jgi:excisionase family DNA binding protein
MNDMELLEPLLTVKDVRKLLPLSLAKIYALLEQGDLRAIRLPGCDRVFVAPADLRAYVQAGRSTAAAS